MHVSGNTAGLCGPLFTLAKSRTFLLSSLFVGMLFALLTGVAEPTSLLGVPTLPPPAWMQPSSHSIIPKISCLWSPPLPQPPPLLLPLPQPPTVLQQPNLPPLGPPSPPVPRQPPAPPPPQPTAPPSLPPPPWPPPPPPPPPPLFDMYIYVHIQVPFWLAVDSLYDLSPPSVLYHSSRLRGAAAYIWWHYIRPVVNWIYTCFLLVATISTAASSIWSLTAALCTTGYVGTAAAFCVTAFFWCGCQLHFSFRADTLVFPEEWPDCSYQLLQLLAIRRFWRSLACIACDVIRGFMWAAHMSSIACLHVLDALAAISTRCLGLLALKTIFVWLPAYVEKVLDSPVVRQWLQTTMSVCAPRTLLLDFPRCRLCAALCVCRFRYPPFLSCVRSHGPSGLPPTIWTC